jgi:hypothetical protein
LQPDRKEASIIAAARWTFFPAAVGKIDRFPGAYRAEKMGGRGIEFAWF